jgi:2-polyprenyl-3-methyl-5-hydroxy-6-metoxy-1,4-benzoquinol methylase
MNVLDRLFNKSRWRFRWRYWRGLTPWDTNITPPEVTAFIQTAAPAKALDLGCGTGTNAIALADAGWEVVGVDFAAEAIKTARRKAAAAGLNIAFYVADVTDLSMPSTPFDYVLDIGCLFTLKTGQRYRYVRTLEMLLAPQGTYMLYAWLPRPCKGRVLGISVTEVQSLFAEILVEEKIVIGEEKGYPSAWYWFRRRCRQGALLCQI